MTIDKPLTDDYIKGWADGAVHESKELRAHIAALEAENKRLTEAYGAHTLADAYSSTFPDNAEDEKYLKRQETFWRLTSRVWCGCDLYFKCAAAAKAALAQTDGKAGG